MGADVVPAANGRSDARRRSSSRTLQPSAQSFVRKVDSVSLERLLQCLHRLVDMGHTRIESSESFAATVAAKLGDAGTGGGGSGDGDVVSPARQHPLICRIPREDLCQTHECMLLLTRVGMTSIEDLSATIDNLKAAEKAVRKSSAGGPAKGVYVAAVTGGQAPRSPRAAAAAAASSSPPGTPVGMRGVRSSSGGSGTGGGGYSPRSPRSPPRSPRSPCSATSERASASPSLRVSPSGPPPQLSFSPSAPLSPLLLPEGCEWHDDEERAFENTYAIEDCDLCQEMICEDTFAPHWANGKAPPMVEGTASKLVIETTKVQKGQDDLGQKMINQYTILGELGRGAFGKVKLAMHVPTQKRFAIKILNKSLLRGVKSGMRGTAMDTVLGEVAIMKRCNHKNVCRLVEVIDDENDGKMYLIVDYYEKGPLFDIKPGCKPLEVSQLRKFLIDVCQGLDYLHHNNIIHRDIKPANILVGGDNHASVTDFGISHAVSEGDSDIADTNGTPAFLTPEQITNEKIEGRMADIWALGVTFYAMTFGRLPFTGDSYLDLCRSVQQDTPCWDGCDDADLLNLLQGILHKNLACRIGRVNGVRDVLASPFLAGQEGAAVQTHSEISVSEEDKSKAIVQGNNIQLRLGNTVGVMVQVKGAVKGFLQSTRNVEGKARRPPEQREMMPPPAVQLPLVPVPGVQVLSPPATPSLEIDTILEEPDGDDESSEEEAQEEEEGGRSQRRRVSVVTDQRTRGNASFMLFQGSQPAVGPLTTKRSFRTEEQAVMEDMCDTDIIAQIESVMKEGKTELTLNCFKFTDVPPEVLGCTHLTSFTSHQTGLVRLPDDISKLANLHTLSIAHNSIETLPDSIVYLKHLERLDCNHNCLSTLPDGFSQLSQLRVINLDYNNFSEIPVSLCHITELQQCFIIQNEKIGAFPKEMAEWTNCRLSLTNTPHMCKLYEQEVEAGAFPKGVRLLWNKLYPDKVEECLYLGSLRTAQTEGILRQLNITGILTAGKGLMVINPLPVGIEQVTINVDDSPEQKFTPFFDDIAEYIERETQKSHKILVHCFAGLSRSVACVCAYLIKCKKMTFKDAITLVKKARPSANPNNGFRKQLIEYEYELYGTRLDPSDVENYSNGPSVEPEGDVA